MGIDPSGTVDLDPGLMQDTMFSLLFGTLGSIGGGIGGAGGGAVVIPFFGAIPGAIAGGLAGGVAGAAAGVGISRWLRGADGLPSMSLGGDSGATGECAYSESQPRQARQLKLFPNEPFNRLKHYGRTPNAEQKRGALPGLFDHDPALVIHYYEGDGMGGVAGFNMTGAERLTYATSLKAGKSAPHGQRFGQGGKMRAYSLQSRLDFFGF